MHPMVTFHMASGRKIVLELLPEAAPNTVNSFLWCASRGWLDHHAIQRVVPGNWIDLSYTAFHREECKYLIPRESALHPELVPLEAGPGCACMGGYGNFLPSCEVFFPLRRCPEHRGIFPVFGRVAAGMEELYRIERILTRPVVIPGVPVEINEPLVPQVIQRVEVELFGETYPEPIRAASFDPPLPWTLPGL